MIITEDEAKTKWCPFAKAPLCINDGTGECVSGNRAEYSGKATGPLPKGTFCIASDCMAWRETKPATEGVRGYREGKPAVGYCGLAGDTP